MSDVICVHPNPLANRAILTSVRFIFQHVRYRQECDVWYHRKGQHQNKQTNKQNSCFSACVQIIWPISDHKTTWPSLRREHGGTNLFQTLFLNLQHPPTLPLWSDSLCVNQFQKSMPWYDSCAISPLAYFGSATGNQKYLSWEFFCMCSFCSSNTDVMSSNTDVMMRSVWKKKTQKKLI